MILRSQRKSEHFALTSASPTSDPFSPTNLLEDEETKSQMRNNEKEPKTTSIFPLPKETTQKRVKGEIFVGSNVKKNQRSPPQEERSRQQEARRYFRDGIKETAEEQDGPEKTHF